MFETQLAVIMFLTLPTFSYPFLDAWLMVRRVGVRVKVTYFACHAIDRYTTPARLVLVVRSIDTIISALQGNVFELYKRGAASGGGQRQQQGGPVTIASTSGASC